MAIKPFKFILDRKIRFALIGCGRISKNHFEAFQKHSEFVELVAICDNNRQSLEVAAKNYNVCAFDSMKELLRKTDADVITLCTPSGLHPQQAIDAANAGKHVVTEKPMATTWSDGLAMVKACEKNKVQLFVVKQNRFNPPLQAVKKAIDQGRFGRIFAVNVNVNVFWTRPQEYYDQASWRGKVGMDGGAIMNQASHYVDLLTWLIGPIDSVHAFTATLARRIECEDTGVINLKWIGGALGTMAVSMLTYPRNLEGSITIIGEKGTVKIGGTAVNRIEHWEFESKEDVDQEVLNLNYETKSVYGFGHPKYYENVIQTLRGEASAYTDGNEGLKSLELLVATYVSAAKGIPIKLPLSRQTSRDVDVSISTLDI